MKKIYFLLFLFPFVVNAQVNLNNGLQAYYPFSGNANEAVGTGVNGIENGGVALTTDRFGNANSAYFFDGVDDYIRIPNNPTINSQSAFTVTAFFQSNTTSVATILGKIDYLNGIGTQYQVAVNFPPQPGVLFGVNQPGSNCAGTPVANFYVNSGGIISQNRWYCFATTFENGVMKLYLDGALISTTTASFQTITNCLSADVQIGSWWNGDRQRFRGKIDDIRFYNRALNGIEIASLCSNANPIPCNSWLSTPAQNSFVNLGQLNVPGNKITVEALFNRTTAFNPGDFTEGDLVSKHDGPSDANYLLRPNHAYITTSNGFFATPDVCPIELNKTYHVAMVYDGATLKYYRNGFLMSQVNATGNLIQNNWAARIGKYQGTFASNFIGYINEVKIWNVARTQAEIGANMYTTLQSPSTQAGLQAYYSFDNLVNKQGNATWNGTLSGAASINSVNPSCTFTPDSCAVTTPDTIIVNKYTPVLSLDICKNIINVEDASQYNVGDTVLLIQMKGAVIDSTNTAAFGNVTNYQNAGNYEFNYVKSKNGNSVELLNKLIKQYDLPTGKVQLIRVPYYINANFDKVLTCLPWDGSKGGVLAINVRDTLKLNANVDLSSRGFRGGVGYNSNSNQLSCSLNDFYYPVSNLNVGLKGESIATVSDQRIKGKGKLTAGGGAGQGHNSGGAGGGNGGNGGFGGYQLDLTCGGAASADNRGLGGSTISNNVNIANGRLFLGSGGGAGQADNPGSPASSGGNGGGLIIIRAGKIQANGFEIRTNGGDVPNCVAGSNASDCHDAMGGGGAGGSVLLSIDQYLGTLAVSKNGGKGGNVSGNTNSFGKIGPGGGGGGGTLILQQGSLPVNVTSNNLGGNNGVILSSNDAYGSTKGTDGANFFNAVLPISTLPFKANIDSVRFTPNATACRAFNFNGLGFTNANPIATWQWSFGDGGTASTQNTSHTYVTVGVFNVKLVVTDANSCKDSIIRAVTTNTINVNAGADASYCSNSTVTHNLSGSGGGSTFDWQPAALLNNNSIANPTATITSTTKFYLKQTDALGCSATDSVIITVNPVPILSTFADTALCANSSITFMASGAATYSWAPANAVNNQNIANPIFTGTTNQTMTVTGTSSAGCLASASFNVTVKAIPTITTIPDSTICNTNSIVLTTTGAQAYSWSPATNLDNPNIASPIFSGSTGNTYTVTGTAANGCTNTDVVVVSTRSPGIFNTPPDKSVCINGAVVLDGNNGNGVTYQWSPAASLSNTSSVNPTATPAIVGNNVYNVLISESFCNTSQSFVVNVVANPLPSVVANRSNDLTCSVRTSILNATGAISYLWSPAATLNNATITSPVASPNSNTIYTVVGTDINGCKNSATTTILVNGVVGNFDVPNTFTPNGDNINDCFSVRHWGASSNFIFSIYNRWGTKVFETKDVNKCWDGKIKGQPADRGNYVYFIKSVNACGEQIRKGNVLLIR